MRDLNQRHESECTAAAAAAASSAVGPRRKPTNRSQKKHDKLIRIIETMNRRWRQLAEGKLWGKRKEKKRKEKNRKKKKTLDQLLRENFEPLFLECSAISEAQKSEASIIGQNTILIFAVSS